MVKRVESEVCATIHVRTKERGLYEKKCLNRFKNIFYYVGKTKSSLFSVIVGKMIFIDDFPLILGIMGWDILGLL